MGRRRDHPGERYTLNMTCIIYNMYIPSCTMYITRRGGVFDKGKNLASPYLDGFDEKKLLDGISHIPSK